MSYDYIVFRSTHLIYSHQEIDEQIIIAFASNEAILSTLRRMYPKANVDSNGFGWLDPEIWFGEIHLSDSEFRIFHISRITRDELQTICTTLELTAFDGQKLDIITP